MYYRAKLFTSRGLVNKQQVLVLFVCFVLFFCLFVFVSSQVWKEKDFAHYLKNVIIFSVYTMYTLNFEIKKVLQKAWTQKGFCHIVTIMSHFPSIHHSGEGLSSSNQITINVVTCLWIHLCYSSAMMCTCPWTRSVVISVR